MPAPYGRWSMRLGMHRWFAEDDNCVVSPLLRSLTSRSDDPGPRQPRLEPEQTRSRLARGIVHRATRYHRGRAWPGTQNERTSPHSGIGVRIRAVAAASTVVLFGLVTPDFAGAQANKNKTPAAQPSSAKPKITPGSDPGGVAVAIIGSGVNYTLPQISSRLARDGEGDIIGLDFIDRDNRPFDVAGPDATPDGFRPHGTTLASVLLADAPKARLVPVRIGMTEPRAFGGAVAFVASTPARIALVAFTSPNRADWEPFERAAKAAPNVLFVLPAGDNGQDLDKAPLYPASLGLANAIVVTAAEAGWDGNLPSVNAGGTTVDIEITPAARIKALAADGGEVTVGGSGYAAARVAALAANFQHGSSIMSAAELKAKIIAQVKRPEASNAPRTRHGTIAYPLGGWPIAPRF